MNPWIMTIMVFSLAFATYMIGRNKGYREGKNHDWMQDLYNLNTSIDNLMNAMNSLKEIHKNQHDMLKDYKERLGLLREKFEEREVDDDAG